MNARKHRRVFFYVVPLAAPLVFLAVLEGLFRVFGVGTPSLATDPARGFLPFNTLFEERTKDGGERELVVKTPPVELPFMNLRQFNPQSVVTPKPPAEFRIVVVGGSVVYGWPYDDRLSFPRLLEVGLRAAEPTVSWRVINMGAPGWGSTRLRSIADELQRLQADVAVIVSGNNEAIEAAFAQEVFADREGRVRSLSWMTRRWHVMSFLVSSFWRIGALGEPQTDLLARTELELSALVAARPELIDIYARNLKGLTDKFK